MSKSKQPSRYISVSIRSDHRRVWRVIVDGSPICRDTESVEAAVTVYRADPAVASMLRADIPVWDGVRGEWGTLEGREGPFGEAAQRRAHRIALDVGCYIRRPDGGMDRICAVHLDRGIVRVETSASLGAYHLLWDGCESYSGGFGAEYPIRSLRYSGDTRLGSVWCEDDTPGADRAYPERVYVVAE